MAKTIQVRVEDELKNNVDELFASLGLDTSTAIRMFLLASMAMGGIPFAVRRSDYHDEAIMQSIARRNAGEEFPSGEESIERLRAATKRGAERGL